jgi:hypothetical protein
MSMQNPRNAESFSSLSLISHRATHLIETKKKGSGLMKNCCLSIVDIPLPSKVVEVRRDGSWADKGDPTDRHRRVLHQAAGALLIEQDGNEAVNQGHDVLLKRGG